MKLIKMRCFYIWVAVTGQITITLVVGHDQDDIGPGSLGGFLAAALNKET